jgi:hypothetical protein
MLLLSQELEVKWKSEVADQVSTLCNLVVLNQLHSAFGKLSNRFPIS